MTSGEPRPGCDRADAERIWAEYLNTTVGEGWQRRAQNRHVVEQFLMGLCVDDPSGCQRLVIDEPRVRDWMIRDVAGQSPATAAERLAVLDRFFRVLAEAGQIETHPLAGYRTGHRLRSWQRLVRALQAEDPRAALADLYPPTEPAGPLDSHVRSYIDLQQALGKGFQMQRSTLRDLDRFLRTKAVESPQAATSTVIEGWMATLIGETLWRAHKATGVWKTTQTLSYPHFCERRGTSRRSSSAARMSINMECTTDHYDDLLCSGARRLTGHQRRLFQAEVATELCGGSARLAERRFGWGRDTVEKGLNESHHGVRCLENFAARGRRRSEDKDPQLAADIRAIVEPHTYVDPELQSSRRYTNLSAAEVRAALIEKGHPEAELPCERTMRDILNRMNYRLKRIQKGKPLKKTEETDAIFANVKAVREQSRNDPEVLEISMDTKAKVSVGDYVRGGKNPDRRSG